jgi:HEAT repeat protein
MRTRWRVGLAILGVALFGGFAWLISTTSEPSYQGKTLTEWLREEPIIAVGEEPPNTNADEAIRRIGPVGVPTLVRLAGTKDTEFRKVVLYLQEKKWVPTRTVSLPPGEFCHEMALFGFRALGAKAEPAVPALINLLGDPVPDVRETSGECLACIGAGAEPAVPVLIHLLDDSSEGVRRAAATCLGRIGPGAAPAVDALIRAMERATNQLDLDAGADALGMVGPAAREAVPILFEITTNGYLPIERLSAEAALIQLKAIPLTSFIEQLGDTSDMKKWNNAVEIVGGFATNAETAIPYLLGSMSNTNTDIQASAISLLGQIHLRPDQCVPRIVPFLSSTNGDLRYYSLYAVAQFGTNGKPAVGAILDCLREHDLAIRQAAEHALQAIDPEALAEANRNGH